MAAPPLVLASSSPRRREILGMLGLACDVRPADVPEVRGAGEPPPAYVERLARTKAEAVAARCPGALVLAGDTVVVLKGAVLEKPASAHEAVEMLLELSGQEHTVLTALALSTPEGNVLSRVDSCQVFLRPFDRQEAEAYVATGEPMDKAGAYGIQGQGAALVASVRGDYFTVVGLPVSGLLALLQEAGHPYRFENGALPSPRGRGWSDVSAEVPLPVRWAEDRQAIDLLDQRQLPESETRILLETPEAVADAIRTLAVRGAPAIGIAGAMAVALGMRQRADSCPMTDARALGEEFQRLVRVLRETRPTGRNLGTALDRLEAAFDRCRGMAPSVVAEALRAEADAFASEDREACRRIGEFGADLLPEGARVLTHCNAGALATGGIGTALAPVYTARSRGNSVRVFACETRPVLQGARLTAWELGRSGVEVTVVTDSMGADLMRRGEVDLVLVGADVVAANGDTANKIGTYGLAVQAAHHGLPFYVALPRATFAPTLASGAEVPIEMRPEAEIRGLPGAARSVPEGVRVWNPAFDVTPAHLVTAFLTEGGVLRPPFEIAIRDLLACEGVIA